MVSSAIFRRCIFSPCRRMISPCRRMISSRAPWLMLSEYGPPCKFYSIENNLLHILYSSEYRRRRRWRAPESPMDEEFVGSSEGWLARYNSRNHNLSLVNPTTNRLVKLPTVGGGAVHQVIAREKEGFALMTLGCGGGLAFCSPWDTNKWTILKGERLYDSVVYSTKHHSLFCISDDKRFQVWDFGVDGVPRLESDWIMDLDSTPISSSVLKKKKKLAYIVCAEHMGVLFLVVRHVRINRGPEPNFKTETDYFEVYEIDLEQQRVVAARDSLLQGLVMFVGINEPLAIPAVEVPSLKPGSVYFTYDRRLRCEPPHDCAKDMGVFDFQKREVSRFSTLIQQSVFSPLWFFPQMSSF